jgi:hypothetical protein
MVKNKGLATKKQKSSWDNFYEDMYQEYLRRKELWRIGQN